MVDLIGDERLDHLFTDQSIQIIQSPTVFSYSIDAVLLARFASMPLRRGKIIDLCTGNGVIPLLMSKFTEVPITGIEIQNAYMIWHGSILHNKKQDQINMIHGDIKDMPAILVIINLIL